MNYEERGAEAIAKLSEKLYGLVGRAAVAKDQVAVKVGKRSAYRKNSKEIKELADELGRLTHVLSVLGDERHPKAAELQQRREEIKDQLTRLVRQ